MNPYALLSSLPTVTAIVGTRIYPLGLPRNADGSLAVVDFPAISYALIGGMPMCPSMETAGLNMVRLEIACWATSNGYTSAYQLRSTLVSAIQGYQGLVGGSYVQNVEIISPFDEFEHELELCRLAQEIRVYFD
jgi:hypothetical protein